MLASPAFIASINADPDVELVLHVGDIHSGKQYCTEAYDRAVFDLWQQFQDPVVYTPGDNEWADCHKAGEGGGVLDATGNPVDYANGDPIANLDLVRSIFFPHPGVTLGRHKMLVLSQAQVWSPGHPSDHDFVENVMWVQSRVLFVTINVPGGSNNDADIWFGAATMSATQQQEMADRTGADLRWLDLAFAIAHWARLDGVVIQVQADMWDLEKGPAHLVGYQPFLQSIADHVTAFGKPVLMLNGDSHIYKSDNPLALPNFHRIVVHGSTAPLEWLTLTIDAKTSAPDAFGPFSWTRIVP